MSAQPLADNLAVVPDTDAPLCCSDGGAQLYELVGFPYYGVYLGLLDVYYAAGARQEVHCELGKIDADAVSIWWLAQTIVLNKHNLCQRGRRTSRTGTGSTRDTT